MTQISTRQQIRLNMAITETEKEANIDPIKHPEAFKERVKKRYGIYVDCFKEVFGKDAQE